MSKFKSKYLDDFASHQILECLDKSKIVDMTIIAEMIFKRIDAGIERMKIDEVR